MRLGLSIALAIAALYLAIWPHELGHAAAAYAFGCKGDWWRTDISWWLWSSWSGAIDYDCVHAKGRAALLVTDGAGIAVNLVLLALAPVLGRWCGSAHESGPGWGRWLFLGTFWWALANYAEAFSYLVINTLWLTSDMRTVVLAAGVSRWPWLGAGIMGGVAVARALRGPAGRAAAVLADSDAPGRLARLAFPVYVGVTGVTMAAARITLT